MFRNNKISSGTLLGALAIMLAALLWSIDGLFLRPRFYILAPELLVFWEHFLGLAVLSPFLFIFWPKIKAMSRKSWMAILWVSLFGGLIGTIFITKAFFAAFAGEVSFATVVILQKLQPIFALLLARVILKEKLPRQFYFWALLAIVASYFLAFAQNGFSWQAIDWLHNAAGFAIIAAFAFGSSTVFGKRIANHLDYRAVAALRFAFTSLLALLLILPTGVIAETSMISSSQWWFLVLIVLTSGAGAMFIYYFGLRRVSASAATILELFWPFSAIVLDYFFNHNYLNLIQSIAFVLLLIAFIKISLLKRQQKVNFSARVIKGQGKGKSLGFATANLDKVDLDITHGIYAVVITVRGQEYLGLMHFGYKDVFKAEVSLEVLIKDFASDIYGEDVFVKVLKKIREVKKFDNPEELVTAINSDLDVLSKIKYKN
ncbi:EamA family transporter [Patescibacteria group bacterium]|nr:EamA family transporter [Patescibacteria group bacterium]